ncbi:uncharacterized protein I206_107280 [Kwoniella pini CBS 10737]|uniref:F-box domain-containing protein n=1 Tax=Kwoniella pini CBS 10737 TaxID=1296096 RepID=A0A1B9HYT5_9TREE|nr:uncharacterized protein I206_05175 [Kwoniella pini CBS 10737]OCF48398.1 hypothetical protein I206_05175 [Kwoniella pini CBS 10737]
MASSSIPILSGPQTPITSPRERSDTILTTSSSDSYPLLQTPPSASILGVLNNDPYKPLISSPSILTRNRQNSYGFGGILASSPETNQRLSASPQIYPSHSDIGSSDHTEPNDIARNGHDELENNGQSSLSTAEIDDTENFHNGTRRSKFKAAVRQRLERSRSSLRNLRGSKNEETENNSGLSNPPSLISIDSLMPPSSINSSRPKKSRLKSLLTISRNPSLASIKSTKSVNAEPVTTHLPLLHVHSTHRLANLNEAATRILQTGHHEITVRDFAHNPNHLIPAAARARHLSDDATTQLDEGILFTKDRFMGTVSPVSDISRNHVTNSRNTARPKRITRPRATSMPLLDTSAALLSEEPEEIAEDEQNLFDTVLPREIKVQILKTLLDMHKSDVGNTRWSGEVGGKRELIKLSRVSKSWQHLCLDGQLWSDLNFTPFAHVLHPNTLKRIVESSLPFITTLSLQGLNTLRGSILIPCLSPFDKSASFIDRTEGVRVWMPNLRSIDLRGANRLTTTELCDILSGSPGLKIINLKGVQACNSEVIRTIARSLRNMESLDVTRCKDLTLGDIIFLIRAMDEHQSLKMKCLRIGGMKSYGRHASEFLPLLAKKLINLEIFDVQECTHIFDEDFEKFSEILQESKYKSRLNHLNLSGCKGLKGRFLYHLIGVLPNLRILELAELNEMFKGLSKNEKDKLEIDLIEFIKTIPIIERIDLDFTGLNGGISDKFLNNLLSNSNRDDNIPIGKNLKELRIGHSIDITSEGLIKLIKGLKNLEILEIDNTSADDKVLKTFIKFKSKGTISIIDCRSIRTSELDKIINLTKCRNPNTSSQFKKNKWEFKPFEYDEKEFEILCTVKSFQSWRNTKIPINWRILRQDQNHKIENDEILQNKFLRKEKQGKSWWSTGNSTLEDWNDFEEEEEVEGVRGCIIM